MSKLEVLRRLWSPSLAISERKPEPIIMKRSSLADCSPFKVVEKIGIAKYLSHDLFKELETESFSAKIFSFYDVENITVQLQDDLKEEFQEKLSQALLEQKEEYEKLVERILRDSEAECCSIYI